jgi:hypothetical protein
MTITEVLAEPEAAIYVGCKNVRQFRRELRAGYWPRPIPINSRPKRWLRSQLDQSLVALGRVAGGVSKPKHLPQELDL